MLDAFWDMRVGPGPESDVEDHRSSLAHPDVVMVDPEGGAEATAVGDDQHPAIEADGPFPTGPELRCPSADR
ncbi:MAG TPA: hypothetical protein VKU86_07385, partial [Acidimicrobiales bacterium]|nr:hypothetical protein [Acidimicrobiales bacterium]